MTATVAFERRGHYYASRAWALKKNEIKERSQGICERCHLHPMREVHHLTYERFGNEPLADLLGLCGRCHDFLSAVIDEDPAPRWAGAYGPVMRHYGLLREPEPQLSRVLAEKLSQFQEALAGSPAEEYLRDRRIPLEVAQAAGLGYVEPLLPNDAGLAGRVVFPGTNPAGEVVCLLGRALPLEDELRDGVERWSCEGERPGYLAAAVLGVRCNAIICNNPFDTLALRAAGASNVVGLAGFRWRWPWAIPLRQMTLAFDPVLAGSGWERVAFEAEIMNIPVRYVAPEANGDDWATQWEEGDQVAVRTAVERMKNG
jgi:hypothetical protein